MDLQFFPKKNIDLQNTINSLCKLSYELSNNII